MLPLILASTSPYRRHLLEAAGIKARTAPPNVDERAVQMSDPLALATELALRKARAVAGAHPDALVLGADQVAYDLENPAAHFGKPLDPEDHRRRLTSMLGRKHALVTGIALVGPGIEITDHETSVIHFRGDIGGEEIAAYVASGEGSGCAGGYTVEGRGIFLIERIEGDWFNVVGLPLPRVMSLLRKHGWRYQ